MNEHEWIKEFPAAITVCDEEGIISTSRKGFVVATLVAF